MDYLYGLQRWYDKWRAGCNSTLCTDLPSSKRHIRAIGILGYEIISKPCWLRRNTMRYTIYVSPFTRDIYLRDRASYIHIIPCQKILVSGVELQVTHNQAVSEFQCIDSRSPLTFPVIIRETLKMYKVKSNSFYNLNETIIILLLRLYSCT